MSEDDGLKVMGQVIQMIEGEHPYLYLDGIVMKRSWAGEVRKRFAAGGLGCQFRRISRDPGDLRGRQGGQIRLVSGRPRPEARALVISDACRGLVESVADFLPEARYQRCMVHFYRNVFSHVPSTFGNCIKFCKSIWLS
jgi:putative transposase